MECNLQLIVMPDLDLNHRIKILTNSNRSNQKLGYSINITSTQVSKLNVTFPHYVVTVRKNVDSKRLRSLNLDYNFKQSCFLSFLTNSQGINQNFSDVVIF